MQMDNIHSQMGYRDPQTASYREKCQRPAAGSCPAFPTLASQNPTQIFPGSDTSLALRSLLKAERNKKRITPTVFKWKGMNFKGLVTQTVECQVGKKMTFICESPKNTLYITVVWNITFHSWFWGWWWTNLHSGFQSNKTVTMDLVKYFITKGRF